MRAAKANLPKVLRSTGQYSLQAAQAFHEWGQASLAVDDYPGAIAAMQEALETYERLGGREHPGIPLLANDLGEAYLRYGWFSFSAETLSRAYAGWKHGDVIRTTLLLGSLFTEVEGWEEARISFREAKERADRRDGPGGYAAALALAGLADCELHDRQPAQAAKLLDEAIQNTSSKKGASSRELGEMLSRRARVHFEAKESQRAVEVMLQAEKVLLESVGPGTAPLASIMETAGDIMFFDRGDDARAEQSLRQGLALRERWTLKTGPYVAKVLARMVALSWSRGDFTQAVSLLGRVAEISEDSITMSANVFSRADESLPFRMTWARNYELDYAISMATQAPHLPAARSLAMTLLLRRKGLVIDLMSKRGRVMRSYGAAGPPEELDAWYRAMRDTSRTQFAMALDGKSAWGASAELDQLRRAQERIETNIVGVTPSQLSGAMKVSPDRVSVEAVAPGIPAGSALVEYAAYMPVDYRKQVPPRVRYAAFVLFPNGRLEQLDLGEAAVIDAGVKQLRQALSRPGSDWKPLAQKLDDLAFRPVRRALGRTRVVFVAADGALSLVPFGALVDESGSPLLRDWSFVALTSGRELFQLSSERLPARSDALVVANPAFGTLGARKGAARAGKGGLGVLRQAQFSELPGTAQEGERVASLLNARLLTGAEASVEQFGKVRAPGILHIATHGYFLDSPAPSFVDSRGLVIEAETSESDTTFDAMFRSGLAFAGANGPGPVEGHVMSAKEALWLDLSGTELVVLSACETGVGEVSTGQGVRGLQQAFTAAGARSLVMSLWKVSDEATRDLMIEFYGQLKTGRGPARSLREAQLALSKQPGKEHPFYWASFVSYGDPSPLRGRKEAPKRARPGTSSSAAAWRGIVTDRGGTSFRVDLSLSPEGSTLEYSGGVTCGGDLTPLERRGTIQSFESRITHGPSRCIARGRIEIEPGPGNGMLFRHYFLGMTVPNATGKLERVTP